MPSPFPGMNPYLENEDPWHTFHGEYVGTLMRQIAPQVSPRYIVQCDENVYIHERSADERLPVGRPDGFVADSGGRISSAAPAVATPAPAYARLAPAVDIVREPFLVIRDRRDREVVTVVELLSPTNKRPGGDRDQYLAKRRQYLASRVNFVEIDLLRGWERMPLDELPESDYCVAVSRVAERPQVPVWPIPLRDALPTVPIPVREGEPDARADLQAALHFVYDGLRFGDYVSLSEPRPPLRPEDAAWVLQFVPATQPAGAGERAGGE